MARITVIGGTGYAGGHIVKEAAGRGHTVTSISRTVPDEKVDGVTFRAGSVLDDAVAQTAVDADVVIVTVSPRGDMVGKVAPAAEKVAELARAKGTRFGVIGGAGSLQVEPNGPRLMDTAEFPDAFKAEAEELTAVLNWLTEQDDTLDWFFVSPAAGFGAYAPGEATGTYRTGGDVLLTDENGESNLSGQDLAAAIVDEIERPVHHRQRFTVAY
ncbi:NAD-dependent epimerase [Tersicoccus solisilvae]|uniref:NAD-dependent epimerase n=1 Tax=Tersicoccus solisilvae TaxID=1882339 RepID=A0ABQ1NK61_9MICC|nr:NAD(P)H-binding protein [Tersicoccus solisilvae]GGC79204.1 NAD-dependent epimerase [Tersicoccus solisilvae]